MYRLLLIPALLSCTASFSFAQEESKPEKPKTKLGVFMAQDGAVIVRGFTTIGTVKGIINTSVSVDSKEFNNATSGKKEYGITIEVKENRTIANENTSYIDYDEIESLLKGLDYISKIDKTVTKLADFQADYRTKDDLEFSTFSREDGSINLAIKSGRIRPAKAYFKQADIAQVRELIVQAKAKIDSIKQ